MYTYRFSRFGLSTGLASAFIDSVTVVPNFSKTDFSKKTGYQKDRIVLTVPRINISQIDLRTLVSDRRLNASRVSLEGVTFEDYLDKRVPFPAWQRPLMPAQMVSGIKFPVSIDTISLSNGFVSYEEQSGDEPGRIFFDRMNATLTGFETPPGNSGDIKLHGSFRLMGIAPTEAWFTFLTGHPRDSFTVHATIGKLDLTAINPMLSKLVPASIKSGTAGMTEIIQLNGNKSNAFGLLNFRYSDLAIRLHQTRPGTWNYLEPWLLTGVANLYLAGGNPNQDGKMKSGIIYFERDTSKGFFNFVWKSTLSGIKSSVGINSKTQKKIKNRLKP
ncbi:MAG: DUF748 domain-containing protein [Bacteroidetes bacterium]|nr:DUF748 domain-containing protein [Bacteroidota bacterium]